MVRMLVLSLALVSFSAQAASWGLHGGVNMSNFASTPDAGTSSAMTLNGGLFYEADLAPSIHLQPELNYAKYNSKVGDVTGTNPISFLEVPVLLKAKMDAGGAKPYVVAGPALGLKVGGENAKSINFALQFGAGVEIPATQTMALNLDLRYNLGLSDLNDPAVAGTSTKTKGLVILAGAGWTI